MNKLVSGWRAAAGSLLLGAFALTSPAVFSAGQCSSADQNALVWLDRMSRSLHEVSYSGVVTLQRGDDMQVMQVSHLVHGTASSEQLTQLTGQGAQVERVGHPLHCVHPGHRLLQFPQDLEQGNCGLAEYYRFAVGEGERIAGRKAVRILVQPRDMYRHGYVLELDRETGLLLKAQTVGRGQEILERYQFASLSYEPPPPASAEISVVHEARHSLPENGATVLGWTVNWLPAGFVLTDTPEAASGRRTYTDGLAVFSIFLEELGREIRPGEGMVRRGGTTSYTRGMELTGKPVLVTVLGEIPVNTARMVADSVDWEQ